MKNLLIFGFFSVFAYVSNALPVSDRAKVVKYDYKRLPNNGYELYYETSDGQKKAEVGVLKLYNEVLILTIEGWYSYIGDDGREYMVNYTADENGYIATGAHLPGTPMFMEPQVRPPRPPFIQAPLPPQIVTSLLG